MSATVTRAEEEESDFSIKSLSPLSYPQLPNVLFPHVHNVPSSLIADLKKLQAEDKKRYGYKNTWFVFGTDEPLKNSKLRLRKNQICRNSGLRQIRIHDFRHSCASLLINNGANITMVAKYLGHTKIDETLNTYSHMYKSKLNDIVGTINQLY